MPPPDSGRCLLIKTLRREPGGDLPAGRPGGRSVDAVAGDGDESLRDRLRLCD